MNTERTDYELLLEALAESREHLRVMKGNSEQQDIDLAKVFYRIDSAAAAIRALLVENARVQRLATKPRSVFETILMRPAR